MEGTSSQAFFRKLIEKEGQKAQLLYAHKDKENRNSQLGLKQSRNKQPRIQHPDIAGLLASNQHQQHWYLDNQHPTINNLKAVKLIQNWLCFDNGMVEFNKVENLIMQIIEKGQFEKEIRTVMGKRDFLKQGTCRSMVIEIWLAEETEALVDVLMDYALPFLNFGKGVWSLAALTTDRRFDLLSLDTEGTMLNNKNKDALSKVQLEKEKLMKRVFGFSAEKERELSAHGLLAKLQLPCGNIINFIIQTIKAHSSNSIYRKMIERETIMQGIENICTLSFIRTCPSAFEKV